MLELLGSSGCEVGVCVSAAGAQVLAAELYSDEELPPTDALARFGAQFAGGVRFFAPSDFNAPYASGSAKVDGYVICPCSMATAGAIATGAGSNLIHRAATVALKEERKLVLVPRETPLSLPHLEALLKLRRAGATILFAAPAFYQRPTSIADLVDTVVARVLDQLGIEHQLGRRWGQERS